MKLIFYNLNFMVVSTQHYTHIGVEKGTGREILMTAEAEAEWTQACLDGYGNFLVVRDLNGFVLFKGNANLIEKSIEIDIKKQQRIEKEIREQKDYEKKFLTNKEQKEKWTKDKLRELADDEIQYFIDQAKHELKSKIESNILLPGYVDEYAMCLMRKYYDCPFK